MTALFLAAALPFGQMTVFAGTARIAFSDPSAGVGEEFTVSVKVTTGDGTLGASDVMLSYDPAYIEFVSGSNASGGGGSVRLIGTMDSDTTTVFSYNLKFKALQAGNTTISVGDYEVYDKDSQAVEVTKVGSSAVKVKAPSNYSKDASLASLKVSPGSLSPAFSADVTSYTVNVGSDVSKIAVSANAKDGNAKVVVSDCNLKEGTNTVVCKVTAEDGQTVRSYTLTVNRSDAAEAAASAEGAENTMVTQGAVVGELKADIDGVEYSVAETFDAAALPEGYTQGSCTYGNSEVMCGTGNGLTLLYLQDSAGAGGFYIYAPESGALSPYVTIDVSAKSIVVLPVDDTVTVPEGFTETIIELNGNKKVKGWVWQSDEEQQYCVVYGMNESGEMGLYRYDIAEKTFQRYFVDPALKNSYNDEDVDHLVEEYNSLRKDYNIRFFIIVALIVVALILFFMVVNLLLKRREQSGGYPPERNHRDEAPTPVKRRAMQEEEDRRGRPSSQTRAGRQESASRQESIPRRESVRDYKEEAYPSGRRPAERVEREASSRPSRPESLRVYREEPARGSARGAGERVSRPDERVSRPDGRGYREADPRVVRPEDRSRRPEERTARPERSARPEERTIRSEQRGGRPSEADRERAYRDYDLRKNAASEESRRPRTTRPERSSRQESDLEEVMRQREIEREERARRTRERLERERLEDERRARAARAESRTAQRPERSSGRKRPGGDDDFEFLDL